MDETTARYRACFSTEAGRLVLGHLLAEAGYFDCDLKTEGEVAVQNFAKKILKRIGATDSPEKIQTYVNKLLEM